MTHILAIIIIALVARGVAFLPGEDGPLSFVYHWYRGKTEGQKRWIKWWLFPLGFCGQCSVWLYGTPAIWALGMMPDPLWILPIYWVCATGLQDLFP